MSQRPDRTPAAHPPTSAPLLPAASGHLCSGGSTCWVAWAMIAEPDDVAAAVAWLASDDARYVTGSVIPVDAGQLNKR